MQAELFQIAPDLAFADAAAVRAAMDGAARAGAVLRLGDAWPGLHVVMTGEMPIPKAEALKRGVEWFDDSLENVLLGGAATPYRTGFGPVCRLAADEVARLVPSLQDLTPDEVGERFDPEDLADENVPPGGWDESRRQWLVDAYTQLRRFFIAAAGGGRAILIAID